MRRFAFSAAMAMPFILLLFSPSSPAATGDSTGFFNQSLGDFSEELEVAREEGKKGVLLFFEMDECPFCARMKTSVLNQSDVQAFYAERFLVFDVDVEGELEIVDFEGNATTQKEFAKRCRVRATPVFVFYDLEGNPTLSVPEKATE